MTEAELDRWRRRLRHQSDRGAESRLVSARLELSDAGLKKMVLMQPQLLTKSVEHRVELRLVQRRRSGRSGLKKVVLRIRLYWPSASRTTWSRSSTGYRIV